MIERNITPFLEQAGLPEHLITFINQGIIILATALVALLVTIITRRFLVRFIRKTIKENKYHWDDALVDNKFFIRLSWLIPITIFYLGVNALLPMDSEIADWSQRLINCGFIIAIAGIIISLLSASHDIYWRIQGYKTGKTIRGYVDAIKILFYIATIILLISALTDRSPWGLLSLMGGLTAVTMLVFKDSILGFVASIKLTGNDMVRVGDWIEMADYDADGDVIDISIHSVKVQNWDKTITTIPTYALISRSFKNWRGMKNSGGRRIKRSLHIDMTSIRFLDEKELEELKKVSLLKKYIETKQKEIRLYNKANNVEEPHMANGRTQTNIGVFRAYIIEYLKQNPKINQKMTFLIRQLEPTPTGLPMQVYVFSNDKNWIRYEALQADIFDHLIAILPMFDLRVFQQPSGYDFRVILTRSKPDLEKETVAHE